MIKLNSALAGKSLMISLIMKRCKAMITWNLFQPDARINLWQVSFLQLQKHFQARPCSFSSYAQSVIHVWIFLCSNILNSFLLKLVFWHFKILFLKIIKEKNSFSDLPPFCHYIELHSVSCHLFSQGAFMAPNVIVAAHIQSGSQCQTLSGEHGMC